MDNIEPGLVNVDSLYRGDVDNSGEINSFDAGSHALSSWKVCHTRRFELNGGIIGVWIQWKAAADVDQDGKILALDAILCFKIYSWYN